MLDLGIRVNLAVNVILMQSLMKMMTMKRRNGSPAYRENHWHKHNGMKNNGIWETRNLPQFRKILSQENPIHVKPRTCPELLHRPLTIFLNMMYRETISHYRMNIYLTLMICPKNRTNHCILQQRNLFRRDPCILHRPAPGFHTM